MWRSSLQRLGSSSQLESQQRPLSHTGGGDILMQERFHFHPRAATLHARVHVRGCSQVVGAAGRPSPLWGIHLEWLLVAVPSPGLIDRMYNAG